MGSMSLDGNGDIFEIPEGPIAWIRWNRLPREVVECHPWECSKNEDLWHFAAGLCGVWANVGLDTLGGLFQPL